MTPFIDPLLDAQEAFVKAWRAAGLVKLVPLRFDHLGDGANPPNARATISRSGEDRDAEGCTINWTVKVLVRLPEGDPRRRSVGEGLHRVTQLGQTAAKVSKLHGKQCDVTEDDQRFGGAGLELLAYGYDMWSGYYFNAKA